ncbi:hypothetical protein AC1031_007294 [Aphanomyces cochlioides]|nr:hypothetical protein AC1031_007294 [Aphanomyces cochlioides]
MERTAEERETRKRLLARRRQQAHRARMGNEITTLRRESAELEAALSLLQVTKSNISQSAKLSASALPWKEIAIALHDEVVRTFKSNQKLRAKGHHRSALISALTKWLLPMVERTPSTTTDETWRKVSLSARSDIRNIGLEWITQRLFENTHWMLRLHGFPESGPFREITFSLSPETDAFKYVWCLQTVVARPWETVRDSFRENLLRYRSCVLWFRDTRDSNEYEPLDRSITTPGLHYGSVRSNVDATKFYYTTREFAHDKGCTFVGRHIQNDEAMPANARQRSHLFWYTIPLHVSLIYHRLVVEPVSASETRLRYLYIKSHQFTEEGFVSVDEEALSMGCDLSHVKSEEMKVQVYKDYAMAAAMACSSRGSLHFDCPLE